MSKSLCVVNTPKNCEECDLGVKTNGKCFCVKLGIQLKHPVQIRKHDKCPLKPVPEKIKDHAAASKKDSAFIDGWNACLENIAGE